MNSKPSARAFRQGFCISISFHAVELIFAFIAAEGSLSPSWTWAGIARFNGVIAKPTRQRTNHFWPTTRAAQDLTFKARIAINSPL